LWFGDLIEHRLIQRFTHPDNHEERYQARWQLARTLGFSDGCHTSRAGLLSSGDRWFAENGGVGISDDDIVFEPESLYRAILFGSALAMISLSNGSRVSELLQVSWNKERRVTRTETVPVLGEDGLPCLGDDGKPVTKEVKIYLQHLLPKGAKTEEERQLFPLSKECMRLLGEIKHVLEQTHGSIPVVYPSQSSAKYEHLKPEQYLFQWGATPDGKQGIISIYDVQILLRFVLHGLDLYTTQGEPVRVTTHLLRHVMSTHARQYRNVPPETIAHFFLHHRLKELTGREPSWSEISDYYFQQTEAQRIASIRADLDEQEEMDRVLMRVAPTPRDLEQKNADLQATYEIWHTLHPTALGNCGCPGLCPRGTDRSLCLGCSYHVEDPEKLGSALAWRESYAQQATLLEAQGNLIDARQARIKVQQLDDMINVMRMQIQEEAAGRYIPIFKVLPSPYREAKKQDEEKS
jgi:integrase